MLIFYLWFFMNRPSIDWYIVFLCSTVLSSIGIMLTSQKNWKYSLVYSQKQYNIIRIILTLNWLTSSVKISGPGSCLWYLFYNFFLLWKWKLFSLLLSISVKYIFLWNYTFQLDCPIYLHIPVQNVLGFLNMISFKGYYIVLIYQLVFQWFLSPSHKLGLWFWCFIYFFSKDNLLLFLYKIFNLGVYIVFIFFLPFGLLFSKLLNFIFDSFKLFFICTGLCNKNMNFLWLMFLL